MPRQPIKQDRAHETRARIIKGSASTFAENGYSGSTIADIIKRSDVTKGALYFHFETKQDVARAVLEAHGAWLDAAIGSVRGKGLQGAVDLTYLFCDALVSDDILRAAARLSVDREADGLAEEPAFRQWERLCVEVLSEAQADGSLLGGAGADPESVGRVAMTLVLGGHLATLVADGARGGIHADMQRFWRIALPGLVEPERLASIDVSYAGREQANPAVHDLVPLK